MSGPSEGELVDETYEDGVPLRLWKRGDALEVWRGNARMFGSAPRREEHGFAEFALAPLAGRDDLTVTLVGLGAGLLLRAIVDIPGVREVEVIERSSAIVRWGRTHLAAGMGGAVLDPRVTVREVDLVTVLRGPDAPKDRFALVLDVDPSGAGMDEAGIRLLESALRPGGVLALSSEHREPELLRRLHAAMQNVAEVAAPSEEPGRLDYFYRARRPPNASARGRN